MDSQKLNQIQILEELSLNALPSLQQIFYDGWILRFAEGYTKRANSITPLYSGSADLIQKIHRCEEIYRDFALKPIFRLTNTPQTRTLDRVLEELGYQKKDSVSVQIKTISDDNLFTKDSSLNMVGDLPNNLASLRSITLENELSQEWLDHFVHAANLPIQHWNTLSTMLDIIPNPTVYCWLKDRHFCSCGFGVLENNYLGLFFLLTAKKQRRQGYASQLISAMLDWGKSNDAKQAYLQVETENQAGINLYNKLGFTEVYQYFYRLKL